MTFVRLTRDVLVYREDFLEEFREGETFEASNIQNMSNGFVKVTTEKDSFDIPNDSYRTLGRITTG